MTQLAATASPGRPFAPNAFWNTAITDKTSIANSAGYVNYLATNIAANGPWITTTGNTHPIYVVPAGTPTVPVTHRAYHPDIQAHLNAVPIPDGAKPSGAGPPQIGSDLHMAIWQPSTDKYWEFWSTFNNPPTHPTYPGWNCGYGGYMGPDFWYGVSEWPGYFPGVADGFTAWDGISWGATASGLPMLGCVMRAREIRQGVIPHALGAAIGSFAGGNGARAGKIAGPARKTDGAVSDVNAPPEGMCFTLPDSFDPTTLNYRLGRIMAEAIQTYGFYVHDGGPAIAFFGEAPESIGANPYTGATGFFEGVSAASILADFPWNQLIALNTTISNFP